MRDATDPWCDMVWNGVLMPLSGNTRLLVSRLILKDDTRVTSDGERQHLQVEHQLDVLFPRIGHAEGRRRQLALLAAGVALLDLLDAPLDLADAVQIGRQPRPVSRSQLALQPADVAGDAVEDALVGALAGGAIGRRPAVAEQVLEGHPRIDGHRHAASSATTS